MLKQVWTIESPWREPKAKVAKNFKSEIDVFTHFPDLSYIDSFSVFLIPTYGLFSNNKE